MLTVAGRRTGQPQTTPVSPVQYDRQRWLIAGWADAGWVKNLRASGWATLTKGTRVERIRMVEVTPKHSAAALCLFVYERGGGRYAFGPEPDAPLASFEHEAEAHPDPVRGQGLLPTAAPGADRAAAIRRGWVASPACLFRLGREAAPCAHLWRRGVRGVFEVRQEMSRWDVENPSAAPSPK